MRKKFGKAFQIHLAASVCRCPYVMARVGGILDPDMFDDPAIGDVVAYSINYFKENGVLLTSASLSECLDEESEDALATLWEDDVSDEQFVIDSVVEFARQQAVETAVVEAADKIAKGEHGGIVEGIREALSIGTDMSDVGIYVRKDFEERKREYTNPSDAGVPRMQTGLSHLDECLGGGLEAGTLGCFLGPPKSGKSSVLVNVGHGAASGSDGVNVVHYALEMSARQVVRRYDKRSANKGLNAYMYSNPRKFLKNLRRRQRNLLGGDVLVKGYSTRQATPSMIRSHLSYVSTLGFSPGLVVVDYADIMRPERRLGEPRHEQASIYEDLRAIAQDFNVPVWTASQANRSALGKEIVTMREVAESHEKSMIVDALVAICRTDDEMVDNRGRFFVAAIREFEGGNIIEANFDLANTMVRTLRFKRRQKSKKKSGSKKGMSKEEYREMKEKENAASARKNIEEAE